MKLFKMFWITIVVIIVPVMSTFASQGGAPATKWCEAYCPGSSGLSAGFTIDISKLEDPSQPKKTIIQLNGKSMHYVGNDWILAHGSPMPSGWMKTLIGDQSIDSPVAGGPYCETLPSTANNYISGKVWRISSASNQQPSLTATLGGLQLLCPINGTTLAAIEQKLKTHRDQPQHPVPNLFASGCASFKSCSAPGFSTGNDTSPIFNHGGMMSPQDLAGLLSGMVNNNWAGWLSLKDPEALNSLIYNLSVTDIGAAKAIAAHFDAIGLSGRLQYWQFYQDQLGGFQYRLLESLPTEPLQIKDVEDAYLVVPDDFSSDDFPSPECSPYPSCVSTPTKPPGFYSGFGPGGQQRPSVPKRCNPYDPAYIPPKLLDFSVLQEIRKDARFLTWKQFQAMREKKYPLDGDLNALFESTNWDSNQSLVINNANAPRKRYITGKTASTRDESSRYIYSIKDEAYYDNLISKLFVDNPKWNIRMCIRHTAPANAILRMKTLKPNSAINQKMKKPSIR